MIGRHMTELVELSVIRELKPFFDRVLAGERFRHTYSFDHLDASKRAMVVDYVPHEDENGHVAGFFTLGQEFAAEDSDAEKSNRSTALRFVPML